MFIVQHKTNLCQLRASLQSEGRGNVERSRVVYEVTSEVTRYGGMDKMSLTPYPLQVDSCYDGIVC